MSEVSEIVKKRKESQKLEKENKRKRLEMQRKAEINGSAVEWIRKFRKVYFHEESSPEEVADFVMTGCISPYHPKIWEEHFYGKSINVPHKVFDFLKNLSKIHNIKIFIKRKKEQELKRETLVTHDVGLLVCFEIKEDDKGE